jgi:hypothetical protein
MDLFLCKNRDLYPPFKNGFYLEEYFLDKYNSLLPKTNRLYIPFLWTNFQIELWFQNKKNEMQEKLDEWVKKNHSKNGYFTLVQYDDGCLLNLPDNTIVYGCCSGNIPIPLIYEDRNNILVSKKIDKTFNEKKILCSFIGTLTHYVRNQMSNIFKNDSDFIIEAETFWTPNVSQDKQNKFIQITCDSKFALCPRGYGRSSFRFFEVLNLGCVPIYIWDDIEWLPYKDEIDYSSFCISLNIKDIGDLKKILMGINNYKYNEMIEEYNKIKYKFTLDGVFDYIVSRT